MKKTKLAVSAIVLGITFLFSENAISQCSGTSIQFDGTDDFLHSPFQNYDFSNFTVECWINVPAYNRNVHYVSLQHYAYIIIGDWIDTASITTWAAGLEPVSVSSPVFDTTDTWYHIAFVYDGTSQYLYINGVIDSITVSTGTMYFDTVSFNYGLVVGARFNQTTQFVDGKIDEVRIWNIPRTQVEIQNSMNSLLAGNEEGLVAYYQFEDGPGSDTVTDISGNGNMLTLHNMDIDSAWNDDSPVGKVYNFAESVSVCSGESYTFPDGAFQDNITSQVIHVNNLLSVNSCDSTITTTVNVDSVDISVSQDGNTLTANVAGAVNQWIDCNNENAIIEGETGQSFTAEMSGDYAIIITENSCTDTSDCYDVTITGINENGLNSEIKVYPNPAGNVVFIEDKSQNENIFAEVININNQLIMQKSFSNKGYLSIDISDLKPGVYFIRIYNNTGVVVKKFIKD